MPRGTLDGTTAGDLETEILRLCTAGFPAIVIDLRALQFETAAGNRLLGRLRVLTDRHDVTLSVDEAAVATR